MNMRDVLPVTIEYAYHMTDFSRSMEALARRILNKPTEVTVGGRAVVCSDVSQKVHIVDEDRKFLKLLEILGQHSSKGASIVFVDKQEHADSLLKDLMNASYTSAGSLHGGIDQVWSLTQFYSVDPSLSRIGAVSTNAQSRFASVVLDGVLGPHA